MGEGTILIVGSLKLAHLGLDVAEDGVAGVVVGLVAGAEAEAPVPEPEAGVELGVEVELVAAAELVAGGEAGVLSSVAELVIARGTIV